MPILPNINENSNNLTSYIRRNSSSFSRELIKMSIFRLPSRRNLNEISKTPAELNFSKQIFSTGDILNLIISNISTIHERKYLELTCRSFYNACNNIASEVKKFSFKEGNGREYVSDRQLIQFLENTIYVNIKEYIELHTHILEGNKFSIKTYAQQRSKLVIKNLALEYASFFNNISFFGNIKTVCFKSTNSPLISLNILQKIPVLKPTHITFEDYGFQNSNDSDNINIFFNVSIPESVTSFSFMCSRQMIFCLSDLFKRLKENSLNVLIFGSYFTTGNLTNEEIEMASMISSRFQYVKFVVTEDISENINGFIFRKLEKLNLLTNTRKEYEFNLYFLNVALSLPLEINNEPFPNKNSFHQKYLNINTFRVFQSPESNHLVLPHDEFCSLTEALYYMKNLNTLELELDLFSDFENYSNLFKNVSKNVKNIKLYMCENFDQNHLFILSKYAYNLENLQLMNVKSNEITIKLIVKEFRNLKGLSVLFVPPYDKYNIMSEMIKEHETTKKLVFNWPVLEFLEIYCYVNDKNFFTLFEVVEYNTSHQSGKIFFIRNPTEFRNNRYVTMNKVNFQIIAQKSSKNFGIFKKIFSAATNMLGDITLFGTF